MVDNVISSDENPVVGMLSASTIKTVAIVAVALLLGAAGGWFLPDWDDERREAAQAAALEEARRQQRPIYGFVFDPEFVPIANATLTIIETLAEFRSADDGSYDIVANPGNYLVIASAPGYRSAAASLSVLYGQTTRHDFILEPRPVGTPYYEILPFTAMIGCQVAVATSAYDCSAAFSANRLTTESPVALSTTNALTEVHWEAQSQLATHLALHSSFANPGGAVEVADIRGTTGLKIWLLDWFLRKHLAPDSVWTTQLNLVGPLGEDDVWGNKGGTGVGYAQDQAINVYTTVFHFTPGPGNFTALGS